MKAPASPEELITKLRSAVEPYPAVAMAFLYGSAAAGRLRQDSDVDVAVYFGGPGESVAARGTTLDIEEPVEFEEEGPLWSDLEREAGRDVELLVLNRAPATVCAEAVTAGLPILIRNPGLCRRFELAVTRLAEEFRATEEEFFRIKERSRSLAPPDRARLLRILDYVADELADRREFVELTLEEYRGDRGLRRNVERWAEMLINATIDISKIALAAARRPAPQTYRQVLEELSTLKPFSDLPGDPAALARLRNLLAHEYLDLRFTELRRFIDSGADVVAAVADRARRLTSP
ncbi:MAG: HepT-like ribonuclease domain-containing protein [Spirochaetaceae bacterium]